MNKLTKLNKLTRYHDNIIYTYDVCHKCYKIKFDILNCLICNINLCRICLNKNSMHKLSTNLNSIKCTPYYDMITDNIAIGSSKSAYDDFDIIVNLDYPANKLNHMEIKLVEEINSGKKIYYVGIKDKVSENMLSVLNILIPKLLEIYKPNNKILFHCFLGISRSVTLAILFISIIMDITLEKSYNLVKSIRKNASPNSGFVKALLEYKCSNR